MAVGKGTKDVVFKLADQNGNELSLRKEFTNYDQDGVLVKYHKFLPIEKNITELKVMPYVVEGDTDDPKAKKTYLEKEAFIVNIGK